MNLNIKNIISYLTTVYRTQYTFIIFSIMLQTTLSIKDLGIILESNFNFNLYISNVINKASRKY